MWLFGISRILAGLVLGATYPFLTILGLHWGFTPITLQNLNLYGGDVIEGVAMCAVYSQIGIAIGVFLRARKNSKMRVLAGPTAVTGLLAGVTEPILYGIIVRSKRLMAIVAIAGGISGAINASFHVMMTSYVFHNLFSLAMMSYKPMPATIFGISVALVLGGVLAYFFGVDPQDKDFLPVPDGASKSNQADSNRSVVESNEPTLVISPLQGVEIALSDVHDQVFASGSVGEGVAIEPTEGTVKAPFDGTVIAMFPTKHAIGLRSRNGSEILIHIGLDTVQLDGQYFEAVVAKGDEVKQGDTLINFDIEAIKAKGFSMQSPVIITNYNEHPVTVTMEIGSNIHDGDQLMLVK